MKILQHIIIPIRNSTRAVCTTVVPRKSKCWRTWSQIQNQNSAQIPSKHNYLQKCLLRWSFIFLLNWFALFYNVHIFWEGHKIWRNLPLSFDVTNREISSISLAFSENKNFTMIIGLLLGIQNELILQFVFISFICLTLIVKKYKKVNRDTSLKLGAFLKVQIFWEGHFFDVTK